MSDRGGRTALLLACKYGQSQCVNLLLQRGADNLARDPAGADSLDLSLQGGFVDCTVTLLQAYPKVRLGEMCIDFSFLLACRCGIGPIIDIILFWHGAYRYRVPMTVVLAEHPDLFLSFLLTRSFFSGSFEPWVSLTLQ